MKCFVFNHEWSRWHPTSSASDLVQMRICKKCAKIVTSGFLHGINLVPMSDLLEITDKFFQEDRKENELDL